MSRNQFCFEDQNHSFSEVSKPICPCGAKLKEGREPEWPICLDSGWTAGNCLAFSWMTSWNLSVIWRISQQLWYLSYIYIYIYIIIYQLCIYISLWLLSLYINTISSTPPPFHPNKNHHWRAGILWHPRPQTFSRPKSFGLRWFWTPTPGCWLSRKWKRWAPRYVHYPSLPIGSMYGIYAKLC